MRMRRNCVNFDPVTGVIHRIFNSNVFDCLPGMRVGFFAVDLRSISDVTHIVDLSTMVADGAGNFNVRFVDRPAELPQIAEIKGKRNSELAGTDSYVSIPADRPGAEELRAPWLVYRQALRSLGNFSKVGDMIRAWPVRPDGLDPIADWRGTLAKEGN